jgi:peptide/nickel transport system permease protein
MRPWRSGRHRSVLGGLMLLLVIVPAIGASVIAPHNPFAIAGPSLSAPSGSHLMGTDALGRDLFSAVVYGARTSLLVSIGVAVPATLIGTVIGSVAGLRGGWLDASLMRITEFVQIIPRFFLAVVVLAIFGNGYINLVILLALSSWPVVCRSVRSQVLVVRELPYVTAARTLGAKPARIIRREVLPSIVGTVTVLGGLMMADVILIEASLSFLGLGDPNRASWGRLASEAQQYLRVAWWLAVFPGLAIVFAVVGVNLVFERGSDRDVLTSPLNLSRSSTPTTDSSASL